MTLYSRRVHQTANPHPDYNSKLILELVREEITEANGMQGSRCRVLIRFGAHLEIFVSGSRGQEGGVR